MNTGRVVIRTVALVLYEQRPDELGDAIARNEMHQWRGLVEAIAREFHELPQHGHFDADQFVVWCEKGLDA